MSASYALIATGATDHAQQYKRALGKAGFTVQVATTGARAQAELAFTQPDLILLDLDLPDMSGAVVLRQIHAHRRFAKTGLILISSAWPTLPKNVSPPASHILTTPIKPADLTALANKICNI